MLVGKNYALLHKSCIATINAEKLAAFVNTDWCNCFLPYVRRLTWNEWAGEVGGEGRGREDARSMYVHHTATSSTSSTLHVTVLFSLALGRASIFFQGHSKMCIHPQCHSTANNANPI